MARIEQTIIAATPSPRGLQVGDRGVELLQVRLAQRVLAQAGAIGRNFSGNGKARTDGFGEGDCAEPVERADQFAVAVIGCVGAENAALAGGESRHAQRDLVRLGAAAAQDDALDLRAVQRGEAFAELDDGLVQVTAVDVQRRLLACHRLDHARVGVTDAGDVVVHVDVAAAVGVIQVAALAADDVQRVLVEQRGSGAQRAVAAGKQAGGIGHVPSGAGMSLGGSRSYDAAAAPRHRSERRMGAPHAPRWRRQIRRRHPGTFHGSPHVWLSLHQGPSARTMSFEAMKSRSYRLGEKMPWTLDCRANMRS